MNFANSWSSPTLATPVFQAPNLPFGNPPGAIASAFEYKMKELQKS
ncbi:hypothetical protein [Scytonema sp. NUACC21]